MPDPIANRTAGRTEKAMDKRTLREKLKAQLITTISDGLEEINASGLGYDEEAAKELITYLAKRGYEIEKHF